jgi:enoyl-CoA hydratase/carnithine racemase
VTLVVERDGAITTLRLNNAGKGNALSPALVEALATALGAAATDGTRLVVLRGEGRHFCTGFDLSDLAELSDGDLLLRVVRIELLLQQLHAMPVTTLAIGSGRTFGAGADLFAACDHRVALEGASFSFPGPAFGLALGTARLAARIGGTAARSLLLAGREVKAAEALALGLATAVVADPAPAISEAAVAAARLEAPTVALLHERTRGADDAADLAALVRSAARPGLRARIEAYRAAMQR